ncbi:hypothetical protein BGW39_008786 [Mortierella sp. 14UC]|nr:hypothetical protein BGW39_008786 [Mortierella sp. 14UC]
MTESSSKGFIIYSWVYLAYLFLVYLTMAVRALPLDKGWAFMILMATFIWVSVAVVFGSKAYRMAMVNASTARAERVDTTALDVEVQDAAANLYTAVAGGVLAIASMVVQWMADREEAKIQRTYSTEMEG